MNAKKFREPVLVLLLLLTSVSVVNADAVREYVSAGNSLYGEKKFNEAIVEYDNALVENPKSYQAMFNKANCHFNLDDANAAIDLFKEVSAGTTDMKLVEKAKYNLGNCFFSKGEKLKDSDLKKMIEEYRSAIDYWRQVLDLNEDNENAARNIEITGLIIKDIEDKINKQQQDQEQQQEQLKELIEKMKKLLARQNKLTGDTGSLRKDATSGKLAVEELPLKFDELATEQQQLKDDTSGVTDEVALMAQGQQGQNSQPMPAENPFQIATNEMSGAVENQQTAVEGLTNRKAADAEKTQEVAGQHIQKAIEALTQKQEQDQQQQQQQQEDQQGQQGEDEQQDDGQQGQDQEQQQEQQEQEQEQQQAEQPEQGEQESEEQAEREAAEATVQEILDKEEEDKNRRKTKQVGQRRVEKDW